jgi:hypothetical protein
MCINDCIERMKEIQSSFDSQQPLSWMNKHQQTVKLAKDTQFFWEEKAQRRIKTPAVSSKVPRDTSVIYRFSSMPHYWWLETCGNDFCKPRFQIKMLNSRGDKCSTGTLAWNAGLQLHPRLEDKVPCTILSVAESPDVFVVACKIIRCDSVSFTHNMQFWL